MESDWGMLERPSQHMDRSLSRSCRDSHDSSDPFSWSGRTSFPEGVQKMERMMLKFACS
jgi:hypothetical protein